MRIALLAGIFVLATQASAAPPDRIHGPIDTSTRVVLKGNIHPKVAVGLDRGLAEPWLKMSYMRLVLKPSPHQAAQLEQFLEQQRNPSSPDYQHWLTPEEFGDRFGLNENDLGRITSWLQTEGFTIEQVARARNWIAFSGDAGHISRAFGTEIHHYSVEGETHFANAVEPSIPAVLADVIDSVRGLDNFRPKPPRLKQFQPDYTSTSGTHYIAPDDLAVIYDIAPLFQAGFDGTGQKLVIAGQTDINLSDIRAFRAKFNLTSRDPQLVLYGTDPGVSSGDQMEASLDLEWSGAVARNATIVYVYSQNVFESLQYAIDQNLGTVMSLSYGGCETASTASFRSVAQQANAQGITWMNSSGDSGAAGCDPQGVKTATQGLAVSFPANIPEVTGVGGTEFAETGTSAWGTNGPSLGSATAYLPEKVWNDTTSTGIEAGGGGASAVFRKPWWQAGPGVPGDNSRDVPDVSLAASAQHDGYLMYAQGTLYSVGGTSVSSPAFAGIVTLVNQYVVAKGIQAKPGLGNINPTLYGLAQNTTSIFHDITAGDNIVPCKTGTTGCTSGSFGYKAGPGYDLASGLGSVDAYNLVTKWSSLPAGVGTTMTLTASPAAISQSATTQLTVKVAAVTGSNVPTGTVAFLLGNQSLGSVTLTVSGTSASASFAVSGSSLSPGSNTITAAYSPAASFATSSASAVVTVTATAVSTTTSVAANPAIILSNATTQLTATVKPAGGNIAPAGSVSFSLGSTTLGSVPVSASGTTATATLTVKGISLAIGTNSITASYVATGNFSGSKGTVSVTVNPPPVTTTTSATANPATIVSSASTIVTARVTASSSTTAPAGTVTFMLGNTTLGSAVLTAGTAATTIRGSSLNIGSNSITANYTATGNFSSSSGSTNVTVTVPPVATTTSLSASPASIASTASTVLTATVRASAGSAPPTGTVTFMVGNTTLGSATVSSSAATLTVRGSSLALGNNTVTAAYTASGNFVNSSATTTVTIAAPAVATTMSLAASPSTIAPTATTQVTATVKAASGTATPQGNVTFALAGVTLGSAPLAGSGGTATATLTVRGSSLAPRANTITATYAGAASFTSSTASTTVTSTATR